MSQEGQDGHGETSRGHRKLLREVRRGLGSTDGSSCRMKEGGRCPHPEGSTSVTDMWPARALQKAMPNKTVSLEGPVCGPCPGVVIGPLLTVWQRPYLDMTCGHPKSSLGCVQDSESASPSVRTQNTASPGELLVTLQQGKQLVKIRSRLAFVCVCSAGD